VTASVTAESTGLERRTVPMVGYLVLDDNDPHLVANACTACGALYFDRRNACGACEGRQFNERRLSIHGALRSFSIIYRSAAGISTPYTSAIVDLDGGGVVKANLTGLGNDPARIRLGMRVQLVIADVATDDEGTTAIAFAFDVVEDDCGQ
jgi:uncharacterized OB-fold protein